MAKGENLLGENLRKITPRLRVIANGDDEVNSVRAQSCAGLRVEEAPGEELALPPERETCQVSAPPKKEQLKALPSRVEADVYITQRLPSANGTDPAYRGVASIKDSPLLAGARRRGELVAARVKIKDLPAVAAHPAVIGIELAEPLKAPRPKLGGGAPRAPRARLRRIDEGGGEGVLIGIVDVQGFDFAHADFLDGRGQTRLLTIWDQAGAHRPPPAQFGYGSELTRDHLATALREGRKRGIPPTAYEPQSSMDEGSHGTHVASIAAGNRGICHRAEIAAVLLSLGEADQDRRRSFYDSTRLADAVDYLIAFAEERKRPIAVNVSLGTNGHAHDGSSAISRWIDSALTVPGRAVCVAAGNAGQEAPQSEDDLGYVVGRIHTSGRIAARGLVADLDWLVLGTGLVDVSENELEIWYSPADRFGVSLKPPGMSWTETIEPGQYIENRQLPDGSFFSVYNELYHPANGANYVAIYLTPYLGRAAIRGVPAGAWRVRLHGLEVRDGRFDGWIERDDPVRVGGGSYWAFPSFFAEGSNVDRTSISSLACGQNVIAVANLDERFERIDVSSSQGPTRDGRPKPEIAAPGTDVTAAGGFMDPPGQAWIRMSGTSMASPYVSGVVGLMLARNRMLTAAQILGIIQRTARPLPGADFAWRDDAGYGRIDPAACLQEVAAFERRVDRT
jgi:subtilisin family serine protease